MAHGIFISENCSYTKDGSKIRSAVNPGTALDNGSVVTLSGLVSGERELWTAALGTASTAKADVWIVNTPEVDYVETPYRTIKDFYNGEVYGIGLDLTEDEGQVTFAYFAWGNNGGFVDADGNRRPDAPADVLGIREGAPRGVSIASNRRYVRYQRDGRSANSNQTVSVCVKGRLAGTVVVNNQGRVRSARPHGSEPCPHGPGNAP